MAINQALIIVGPTSSGKTSLVAHIAKNINSVVISADSRQVYKDMDIVTGKDHPQDLKIHGIDLVSPDQEFSVSEWIKLTKGWIKQSWEIRKLPIIVGGTGLYIHALVSGIKTANIPPNQSLRKRLKTSSLKDLQNLLIKLNPSVIKRMNNSDKSNPRRLVRAIEIAKSDVNLESSALIADYRIYALSPPSDHIDLIERRVISRLKEDSAIIETKKLLKIYPTDLESFTSIGYKHIIEYLAGEISRTQLIDKWTKQEYSYSKKQLTWFKKMPQTIWLDSPEINQVVKDIKTWYHENK